MLNRTFLSCDVLYFDILLRDEIEVPLDACPVGHYVLVKFLEPRQNSAERLGIIGLKFYGFNRKAVFVEELALVQNDD